MSSADVGRSEIPPELFSVVEVLSASSSSFGATSRWFSSISDIVYIYYFKKSNIPLNFAVIKFHSLKAPGYIHRDLIDIE